MLAGTENPWELAFSLWSFGGLAGSLGIGYVIDRMKRPQVVMALVLAILLLTITAIPGLRGIPILGLLPFFICGAMGWASVMPQQCSLLKLKADHEAILVALNTSAVSLGGAIGTALGGLALTGGLGPEKLPYVASIFIFCALVCQVMLIQKQHRNQASSSPFILSS